MFVPGTVLCYCVSNWSFCLQSRLVLICSLHEILKCNLFFSTACISWRCPYWQYEESYDAGSSAHLQLLVCVLWVVIWSGLVFCFIHLLLKLKVLGTLCLSRTCERMHILSSKLSSPDSDCPVLLSRLTLIPKVYCHRIAVPSLWRLCCLLGCFVCFFFLFFFNMAGLLGLCMKKEGRPLGSLYANPLKQADKLNSGRLLQKWNKWKVIETVKADRPLKGSYLLYSVTSTVLLQISWME